MNFKQFYLGCLSHASYYIGSRDEAVVIDPQRDVSQYTDEAAANRQRIKYVIETHSHADFISGHLELAEKTGAEIVYGQRANTKFPTHKVKDGDELLVGDIRLKFLETPGHTPESITIVAENTADPATPVKMFTGDTLFIGDVGRPDLIGSKGFTSEQMAGMMYESLHDKILAYPDETEVYPAHGAGSLCGKSLSKETWSTLGNQRQFNYALQPMGKEEFIKAVTANQSEAPIYFAKDAAKNLEGSAPLEDLVKPKQLSTEETDRFEGVVVDVRVNSEYGASHVPNSINIGLGGQFASWAGILIPIGTPIAIAAETQDQVDEAFMRLARVGHESVTGFILIKDYAGSAKAVKQLTVNDVNDILTADTQFIDVRGVGEHAAGHARLTRNLPLNSLSREIDRLDPDKPTFVICQSGYRSSVGTSILENAGFHEIYNVAGGTKAWSDAGLEMETSEATGTAG